MKRYRLLSSAASETVVVPPKNRFIGLAAGEHPRTFPKRIIQSLEARGNATCRGVDVSLLRAREGDRYSARQRHCETELRYKRRQHHSVRPAMIQVPLLNLKCIRDPTSR